MAAFALDLDVENTGGSHPRAGLDRDLACFDVIPEMQAEYRVDAVELSVVHERIGAMRGFLSRLE